MAYLLTVEFLGSRDELPKSRVLEVGELLDDEFRRTSWARIDLNDSRRRWNELVVTLLDDRLLGTAMAAIHRAMSAHGLGDDYRVKRARITPPAPGRRG